MGYLICNKCGGYYELQEGEYPENFDRCQCGGNLGYVEEIKDSKSSRKLLSSLNTRRISGIVIGAAVMLVSFLISSPDPLSPSFAYYTATSFYIWGAGGVAAALIAGGNIRSGASNGFYAASISGLLVIMTYFYMINPGYLTGSSLADSLAFFAALCVVYLLIPGIFSMVGGLLVGIARKIMVKLVRS